MDPEGEDPFRWLFVSDVCKHCEEAGCLEACPTGSIVRTANGAVFVQDDVCNGCGACVVGCPFGVIDRRPEPAARRRRGLQVHLLLRPSGGRPDAGLCQGVSRRSRSSSVLWTSSRNALPSGSTSCGSRGFADARIYDAADTSVRGAHAFFLLLGAPEAYGLPPSPEVPTIHLGPAWASALTTAVMAMLIAVVAFALW